MGVVFGQLPEQLQTACGLTCQWLVWLDASIACYLPSVLLVASGAPRKHGLCQPAVCHASIPAVGHADGQPSMPHAVCGASCQLHATCRLCCQLLALRYLPSVVLAASSTLPAVCGASCQLYATCGLWCQLLAPRYLLSVELVVRLDALHLLQVLRQLLVLLPQVRDVVARLGEDTAFALRTIREVSDQRGNRTGSRTWPGSGCGLTAPVLVLSSVQSGMI